jgi:uncharacterized protein YggE
MRRCVMGKVLFTLLLLLCMGCQKEDPKYIAVSTSATLKVPVEYFDVRIAVSVKNKDVVKANMTTKATVQKLFGIFEKYSIPDSDFVTKSSETSEDYLPSWGRTSETITRQVVAYTGTLVLRDVKLYDAIFADIVALGNTEVGVKDFGSYQTDKYKELAYKQAFDRSKERATMLLAGTNQKVGQIYKILQDGRDRFNEYDDIDKLVDVSDATVHIMKYSDLGPPPSPPSTFKKKYFEMTASITVIYEII